jgi:hypothetical protein
METRRDLLEIDIFKSPDEETKIYLAKGEGSYLENIKFSDERLWSINDVHLITKWSEPGEETAILPSDSTERSDLKFLKTESWESAESCKH